MSTPQFLRLFKDESRDGIYRRLQKLFHHGYLDRIGTDPNAPLVYALGRRGAEVLDVSACKDVGDRYLQHQLMIGDLRVSLDRAAKTRGIEVIWKQTPRDLPVQPDGFFGLRFPDRPDGANRAFFCLEADRSTMPRGRFVAKLVAYQTWYAGGGHTTALGIKSFRVLTVTKSHERLASLVDAAHNETRLTVLRPACWFVALADAAVPGRLFEPIWQTVVAPNDLRSLLPDLGR